MRKTLPERCRGLPVQHLSLQVVIAVAAADALGPGEIVALHELLRRNLHDRINELVDGDHVVAPEVDGPCISGVHDAEKAIHAVINVAVTTRLLPVTPHFDLAGVLGERDLAADGSRGFLAATLVGPERSVDVVEAHDTDVEAVVLVIVSRHLFGEELLPAVPLLRLSGIRVGLLERRDVRVHL